MFVLVIKKRLHSADEAVAKVMLSTCVRKTRKRSGPGFKVENFYMFLEKMQKGIDRYPLSSSSSLTDFARCLPSL